MSVRLGVLLAGCKAGGAAAMHVQAAQHCLTDRQTDTQTDTHKHKNKGAAVPAKLLFMPASLLQLPPRQALRVHLARAAARAHQCVTAILSCLLQANPAHFALTLRRLRQRRQKRAGASAGPEGQNALQPLQPRSKCYSCSCTRSRRSVCCA